MALAVTRSPLLIALVTFCERAPWMLLGTWVGRLTRRFPAGRITVLSSAVQCAICTGLGITLLVDELSVFVLCVFIFALATLDVAFVTALNTLVVRSVPNEDLENFNGKLQASRTFFLQLAGPPAGAVLLSHSAPAVFFTDAATFAVAALLLRGVAAVAVIRRGGSATADDAKASGGDDINSHSTRSPWAISGFRRIALGMAAVAAASGASEAVLGLQLVDRLGATNVEYGLVFVGTGAAGIAAGVGAGWLAHRGSARSILVVTLIAGGLTHIGLALSATLVAAAVVLTVQGVCVVLSNVAATSIRQRLGDAEFAAVSAGAYGAAVMPAVALGALGGGLLIRRISERPWPVPLTRPCSGICVHGRDLSCLRSFFWLPLTITM